MTDFSEKNTYSRSRGKCVFAPPLLTLSYIWNKLFISFLIEKMLECRQKNTFFHISKSLPRAPAKATLPMVARWVASLSRLVYQCITSACAQSICNLHSRSRVSMEYTKNERIRKYSLMCSKGRQYLFVCSFQLLCHYFMIYYVLTRYF